MKTTTLLAAAIATALPAYAATTTAANIEEPSAAPTLGAQVVQGCFSSWGNLIFNSTPSFNSKSACAVDICYAGGFKVAATTGGNQCYCGDEYPPKDSIVDDSKCDVPCPGYGVQACGGIDFYTVYNTGIMLSVSYSPENDTTSGSATPSVVASSTVVSGGQTSVVYVTSSPTGAAPEDKGDAPAPMGGIIAGVVVGVVVLGAAFGGLWFYMRQKRNREIEEEHRRNAAVSAFMGGKPPGSSGGYSMETDTRLDPVMAQRRMSSGSIADNQDYSRRILRVRAYLIQVCPTHANNFTGYQRVMTWPIYDERLLPVLYTSIGIFRRLVHCLMSPVNQPRDEPPAFHIGARKATYLGSRTGRGVYLPGIRCRFLRRPLLRQSFGTSFGMPLARLAS